LSTVSKQTCGNQECESSEGIETFGAVEVIKEEPLEGKKTKQQKKNYLSSKYRHGLCTDDNWLKRDVIERWCNFKRGCLLQ
jgi:hypothetical protein